VEKPAPRSTERMISEAKRARIIKALRSNPNATAVARQIGGVSVGGVTYIAKKEKIALRRGGPPKFSVEKQAQIIKALKANPNASEVARQNRNISYRTVARWAKKAGVRLAASMPKVNRPDAQSSSGSRHKSAQSAPAFPYRP
jgi:hypothetical protein